MFNAYHQGRFRFDVGNGKQKAPYKSKYHYQRVSKENMCETKQDGIYKNQKRFAFKERGITSKKKGSVNNLLGPNRQKCINAQYSSPQQWFIKRHTKQGVRTHPIYISSGDNSNHYKLQKHAL